MKQILTVSLSLSMCPLN